MKRNETKRNEKELHPGQKHDICGSLKHTAVLPPSASRIWKYIQVTCTARQHACFGPDRDLCIIRRCTLGARMCALSKRRTRVAGCRTSEHSTVGLKCNAQLGCGTWWPFLKVYAVGSIMNWHLKSAAR